MMHYIYILYSVQLNKYYIGSTSTTPEERLVKHLANHNGFTSKAYDWKIVHQESYNTLQEARNRELQLKKWKSSVGVGQLISRSTTE